MTRGSRLLNSEWQGCCQPPNRGAPVDSPPRPATSRPVNRRQVMVLAIASIVPKRAAQAGRAVLTVREKFTKTTKSA